MASVDRAELIGRSPDQLVIGVTTLPDGKPCVGMAHGKKMWILAGITTSVQAPELRRSIERNFKTVTMIGAPVDIPKSLRTGKVALIQNADRTDVGIYVPERNFNRLKEALKERFH